MLADRIATSDVIRRFLLIASVAVAPALAAQRPTAPLDSALARIVFSVGESFADSVGRTRIVLRVHTEKPVHCYTPLRARVTVRRDAVVIDRWYLEDNGVCVYDTVGAPYGSFSFRLHEGHRVLAIAHLGAVDRYRLVVTGSAIRVAPIGTPRVSVLGDSTPLWRVPRNSFAFRCGTGERTAWTCAEVFHLLDDEPGLVSVDMPPGRNTYTWWLAAGAEPPLYYRVATPASYDRFVRGVQRLHDVYASPRVGFDVAIVRWTGATWRMSRAR